MGCASATSAPARTLTLTLALCVTILCANIAPVRGLGSFLRGEEGSTDEDTSSTLIPSVDATCEGLAHSAAACLASPLACYYCDDGSGHPVCGDKTTWTSHKHDATCAAGCRLRTGGQYVCMRPENPDLPFGDAVSCMFCRGEGPSGLDEGCHTLDKSWLETHPGTCEISMAEIRARRVAHRSKIYPKGLPKRAPMMFDQSKQKLVEVLPAPAFKDLDAGSLEEVMDVVHERRYRAMEEWEKVLSGHILSGKGEYAEAVVWASRRGVRYMRDFMTTMWAWEHTGGAAESPTEGVRLAWLCFLRGYNARFAAIDKELSDGRCTKAVVEFPDEFAAVKARVDVLVAEAFPATGKTLASGMMDATLQNWDLLIREGTVRAIFHFVRVFFDAPPVWQQLAVVKEQNGNHEFRAFVKAGSMVNFKYLKKISRRGKKYKNFLAGQRAGAVAKGDGSYLFTNMHGGYIQDSRLHERFASGTPNPDVGMDYEQTGYPSQYGKYTQEENATRKPADRPRAISITDLNDGLMAPEKHKMEQLLTRSKTLSVMQGEEPIPYGYGWSSKKVFTDDVNESDAMYRGLPREGAGAKMIRLGLSARTGASGTTEKSIKLAMLVGLENDYVPFFVLGQLSYLVFFQHHSFTEGVMGVVHMVKALGNNVMWQVGDFTRLIPETTVFGGASSGVKTVTRAKFNEQLAKWARAAADKDVGDPDQEATPFPEFWATPEGQVLGVCRMSNLACEDRAVELACKKAGEKDLECDETILHSDSDPDKLPMSKTDDRSDSSTEL